MPRRTDTPIRGWYDVVADILVSPAVSRAAWRAALLAAAPKYRDATIAVTTLAEWRDMAVRMGTDAMERPAPSPSR